VEALHQQRNDESVGKAHICLFTFIKELQKEQCKVVADIKAIYLRTDRLKKLRQISVQKQREQRLKTAFNNCEGKSRLI